VSLKPFIAHFKFKHTSAKTATISSFFELHSETSSCVKAYFVKKLSLNNLIQRYQYNVRD